MTLQGRSPAYGRIFGWLGVAAAALLVCLWLALVIRANADQTAGRFALYTDEVLIFDGIQNILHPAGLKAFVYAVIDGGDQRYGRILFNLSAVTAFLPDRIWGEQGLIVAARMTQALLLALAAVMLAMTCVRRWASRLLLLLFLLVLPYTVYYATMPKPEPLELVFIAAFLWAHGRRGYGLGAHWLLLGLAFGAKIAVLPLALILALDSVWREMDSGTLTFQKVARTAASFALGLGLAVPVLLLPMGIAAVIVGLSRWLVPAAHRLAQGIVLVAALGTGAYFGRHKINGWLDWTFRNTAHGRDEASINASSWVKYLFQEWLAGPVWLNILVAISAGFLVLLALARIWRAGELGRPMARPLVLIVGGLALIGAIFVSSHRLWGFYLVPGMFVLLTGIVALCEENLSAGKASALGWVQRFAAGASGLALAALSLFWWAPQHAQALAVLARRTEDPAYRREYASYQAVISTAAAYAKSKGEQISLVLDPNLFQPSSTALYKVSVFWGPYTAWTQPADLLVFGSSHLPGGKAVPQDSPDHPSYLVEQAGYAGHVAATDAPCALSPCYRQVARLANGGEILARQDASVRR